MDEKISIKPYLVFAVLSIAILIIEGSFFSFFLQRTMVPDLLLIVVVSFAFIWGEKKGVILGLICGILQDLFFGPAIGFFTLAKTVAAYFAGLSSREIYKDQLFGPMLTVFFATFIHEFIIFFLKGLFWRNDYSFFFALDQIFLPLALYHLAMTVLIYPLVYWASQHYFFSHTIRQ